jgi:molybdopterin synthase sulfur carrier subunit
VIRVLFFARLREELGESCLELSADDAGATVGELLGRLRARGDSWSQSLGAENMLCAVNQEQANPADPVGDGDEVAFFPPVTGG